MGLDRDKIFTQAREGLIVRAMAPVQGRGDALRPITFPAAQVEYVAGLDEDTSEIVLASGLQICVALPHQDLEERLLLAPRGGREGVIDLREHCVAPAPAGCVEIYAILRERFTNSTSLHRFYDTDIQALEPSTSSRAKLKKSVNITFNAAARKAVTNKSMCIDMSCEDFIEKLSEARHAKDRKLDLVALFASDPHKYGFNPQ